MSGVQGLGFRIQGDMDGLGVEHCEPFLASLKQEFLAFWGMKGDPKFGRSDVPKPWPCFCWEINPSPGTRS